MMQRLTQPVSDRRRQLLLCFACVFLWGIAAHGYGFMHSNFSHDSLLEFNGDGLSDRIRIRNGRFAAPIYRLLFRTPMTLPWLVGLLGLIWIALTVYLLVRMFRCAAPGEIGLIAGFMTVNLTVSAVAATFQHDFDCDMLALLFSTAAVFFWNRRRRDFPAGVMCVVLSLGLYQSYICVTIVLMLYVCILELLDGEKAGRVICKGLAGCAMLLLGGLIYYVLMKTAARLTGLSMLENAYNSLDRPAQWLSKSWFDFRYQLRETYQLYFTRIIQVLSPLPILTRTATVLLLAATAGMLLIGIASGQVGWKEKLLILVLTALVPFGGNLMHFITLGSASHELMTYAYWLIYLLPLLLAARLPRWLPREKVRRPIAWARGLCALLTALLVYAGVQTANVFYLKKDLEQKAYLSVMTRVVYRMEQTEGYQPGQTPVVIVGLPQQLNESIPGFDAYRNPNGMYMTDVLNYGDSGHWAAYFKYVLLNPAKITDGSSMYADPRVQALPCYPDKGCTAILDGTLYVKLSEP